VLKMLLELRIPALQITPPRLLRCRLCGGITHSHGRNKNGQVFDISLSQIEQRRFRFVHMVSVRESERLAKGRPGGDFRDLRISRGSST